MLHFIQTQPVLSVAIGLAGLGFFLASDLELPVAFWAKGGRALYEHAFTPSFDTHFVLHPNPLNDTVAVSVSLTNSADAKVQYTIKELFFELNGTPRPINIHGRTGVIARNSNGNLILGTFSLDQRQGALRIGYELEVGAIGRAPSWLVTRVVTSNYLVTNHGQTGPAHYLDQVKTETPL